MLVPMTKIIKGFCKTATNLMPNTPEGLIKLDFITAGLYTSNIEYLYAAMNFTLFDQWFGPKTRAARRLPVAEIANSTSEEESCTREEVETLTAPNPTLPEAEVNTDSVQVAKTEMVDVPVIVDGPSEEKSNASSETKAQAEFKASPEQAVKTETIATKYFTSSQTAYKAGVDMFKAHEYDTAIDYLEDAIVLYQKEYSPISKQVATCFSTLSSCYRELAKTESDSKKKIQLHNEAIRFIDQAIAISLLIETTSEEENSKLLEKKKTVLESPENSDNALSFYASAIRALAGEEFKQPCMSIHATNLISKAERTSLSINYEKLTEGQIRKLELPETTINALLISKINPEARTLKRTLLSATNDAGLAALRNFFSDPQKAEKLAELQRPFLKKR